MSAKDRLYRMRLAAVPDRGPCTVLHLDPWQAEELDEVVESLLTDRQWQAIDEAQISIATAVLADEAEHHLAEGGPQ